MKGIQWRYQLWYRVKNYFISIHCYNRYLQRNFIRPDLQVAGILQSKQKEYLGHLSFNFIGLRKSFDSVIDWNFQGCGKLWNYNLQYFSYLLDEGILVDDRLRLLRDFSNQLLASAVPPEPYPVALRIVNTLLFHSRHQITDDVILEALQRQIDYLANNKEYHLLANHLLENAFSLVLASIYMSDFPLYEKSYQLLVNELDEQILADGGHYECSVMYQSILISKLLLCIEASRKMNFIESYKIKVLEEKVAKMLGWYDAYIFPDGTWALMNDAAENIAPTTRYLHEAAEELNIKPVKTQLIDSGFRKIKGANWELLIKTGGVQPKYQPGHVHADVASYCLWYKGQQVVVDSGISTYSISERRNIERGTSAHNTISFNGLNQSDVWGGFRVGKRADVKVIEETDGSVNILVKHCFNSNCIHQRVFTKKDDYTFMINDEIQSSKKNLNKFQSCVQFAAGLTVIYQGEMLVTNDISVEISGVYDAVLKNKEYAVTYNTFQIGAAFAYLSNPESSFTYRFK